MNSTELLELLQDALAPFDEQEVVVSLGSDSLVIRNPLTGMERTVALPGVMAVG